MQIIKQFCISISFVYVIISNFRISTLVVTWIQFSRSVDYFVVYILMTEFGSINSDWAKVFSEAYCLSLQ